MIAVAPPATPPHDTVCWAVQRGIWRRGRSQGGTVTSSGNTLRAAQWRLHGSAGQGARQAARLGGVSGVGRATPPATKRKIQTNKT